MNHLTLTRRQMLQAAGAAGGLAAVGALLGPATVLAQARVEEEHLGPFGPWGPPSNLGSVVNSTFNEYHPAISKDGLSLYISSDRTDLPGAFGHGNSDIWVSQRGSLDDPWGVPVNLGPNINTAANEFAPDFSTDGHWLFFSRQTAVGSKDATIWASYRRHTHDDFGWELAVRLGGEINHPGLDQNAPTFFRDPDTGITTMYFNSQLRKDGPGDFDIYASMLLLDDRTWSGGDGVLVRELSSPQRDTRTAIRRDGLEMFVTSNRPGGPPGTGNNDLWVSTRTTTLDPWSTPLVNLGVTVNSPFDDGGPALSADGTTLYFYSTRPGGYGGRDLYVTTRTRLDESNRET